MASKLSPSVVIVITMCGNQVAKKEPGTGAGLHITLAVRRETAASAVQNAPFPRRLRRIFFGLGLTLSAAGTGATLQLICLLPLQFGLRQQFIAGRAQHLLAPIAFGV